VWQQDSDDDKAKQSCQQLQCLRQIQQTTQDKCDDDYLQTSEHTVAEIGNVKKNGWMVRV